MPTMHDHTATEYVPDDRHTKSLDRAELVISYLKQHIGDPVPVQEIADHTGSYYEEVLHVATTLEALQLVSRFKRAGSPREGARVAYAWLEPVKKRRGRSKVTPMQARAKVA
jgi:DNA-binding IclR family transcriptional regulator